MPRTTLALVPAMRARSGLVRGSRSARASRIFWRASVMRTSVGGGSTRYQPVAGGPMAGVTIRRAIAMTSPGGARV